MSADQLKALEGEAKKIKGNIKNLESTKKAVLALFEEKAAALEAAATQNEADIQSCKYAMKPARVLTDKEKAAAIKEGGKKGQDLSGMADLGGIKFFCVTMEKCLGEMEAVKLAMEGMNKEVDEAGDDRKGGAGNLGKMLLSADTDRVAVYAHVPAELKDQLDIKEWVAESVKGMGPVFVEESDEFIGVELPLDTSKELFPLKMRDLAINQGFAYLKSKSLVLDESSSDPDVNYAEMNGIEW